MNQRTCKHCGEAIHGRSDKKFCDDSCRNTFNNQLKQVSTNLMRNVNNALRRNRLLLNEILGSRESVRVHLEQLLNVGFQLKYHTHTYTTKKGATFKYTYEYGILPTGNDWFLVVKKP